MKSIIVDGLKLADEIYQGLRPELQRLKQAHRPVKLAVVLVGKDSASERYVSRKQEVAQGLGIDFQIMRMSGRSTTAQVQAAIRRLQQPQRKVAGIIVQLPLPRRLDTAAVLETIDPARDVDGLHPHNLGKLIRGVAHLLPPTPAGILHILRRYRIGLTGKHVVMIGAGELVGRPLVNLLMRFGATVSVLNRSTPDLNHFTKQADIIVTGVGQPGLLTGSMIARGAVVIDAGTSFVKGALTGDVDFETVNGKARLLTPTPGGVGPLTVAHLFLNTVVCAQALAREKK